MTACRLAMYWMWNVFRNVHGYRRKVLESPGILTSQKQGYPVCRFCVGSNRLQILLFKLSTVSGRAFLIAAARFWNRLPDNVTSANSLLTFQQQLKHTLFQQSFPDIIL